MAADADPIDPSDSATRDAPTSLTELRQRHALPKWPLVVAALVLVAAIGTYLTVRQQGLKLPPGPGHVVRLAGDPEAWVFLRSGNLVKATAASTARFALPTGPCERIGGEIEGELLEIYESDCKPGPLRMSVALRLREAGLKYGYWGEKITSQGDDPERFLATPEIVAAMSHTRFQDPQLVPLYGELFPGTIARGRAVLGDAFPVPVVLTTDRNDFQLKRYTRSRLNEFLTYPRYMVAGASSSGGWLVREVVIDPEGAEDFESFLSYARRPPFDTLLSQPSPVRVRLRKHASGVARPDEARPPPPGTVR